MDMPASYTGWHVVFGGRGGRVAMGGWEAVLCTIASYKVEKRKVGGGSLPIKEHWFVVRVFSVQRFHIQHITQFTRS